jgi:AcrR family transcriptional regulator
MTRAVKQRRPGGRTGKNRRAVAQVVLKLIGEGNLDFEVQEVAALSGVHRTTIFRRWPDRDALIAEAMAEHVSRVSIPLPGPWKEDLRRIAFGMRDFLNDPVERAMNRMLAITDNEVFHEQMTRHWNPLLEQFYGAIRAEQERGKLSGKVDAEATIWLLISAVVARSVFALTPPDDAYIERILAQVMRSCA